MQHIHAELDFEIGFVVSWNLCATLPYTSHKGERSVTMATNFWTKIAVNAYKCISTRDNGNAIIYNRGFRGQPIQRRHFWLQGSKRRCQGNQILSKIGQNVRKIDITSVVCNICMQSLVWDRVCAIGEFIYDTPVRKGQRSVTMATNFVTIIAINAYNAFLWAIARMRLLITGSFLGWLIQTRNFWLQGSEGTT